MVAPSPSAAAECQPWAPLRRDPEKTEQEEQAAAGGCEQGGTLGEPAAPSQTCRYSAGARSPPQPGGSYRCPLRLLLPEAGAQGPPRRSAVPAAAATQWVGTPIKRLQALLHTQEQKMAIMPLRLAENKVSKKKRLNQLKLQFPFFDKLFS